MDGFDETTAQRSDGTFFLKKRLESCWHVNRNFKVVRFWLVMTRNLPQGPIFFTCYPLLQVTIIIFFFSFFISFSFSKDSPSSLQVQGVMNVFIVWFLEWVAYLKPHKMRIYLYYVSCTVYPIFIYISICRSPLGDQVINSHDLRGYLLTGYVNYQHSSSKSGSSGFMRVCHIIWWIA